ncbi:MAG TPA: UDP-N-acetylglucosamine 1-carboxyvinyltransferase, partial [Polyangiales bacterium]|nr:UDP-N-acetylglucosamine 1-carboxyvinyltransferase [Polyangiales bacterium]
MDSFVIEGGRQLSGEISVAGNKNAALKLLAATLLTDDPVTLQNVPEIRDVATMQQLLADLGCSVERKARGTLTLQTRDLKKTTPNFEITREMRASFVVAGPLLARAGRAELSVPGGDKIGRRPLDTHVEAFQKLGVEVQVKPDRYVMTAPRGLRGA